MKGSLSRRDFLKLSGGAAAAAAAAPLLRMPFAGASPIGQQEVIELTTLAQTIVRGERVGTGIRGSYYRLAYGPGEPHIVRNELTRRTSTATGRPLLSFVHACDNQLADAQSPARVEFLDRFVDVACDSTPFDAAFRPQETLSAQEIEVMNRTLRKIRVGPVTGDRIKFVMFTGDNADNAQMNELRWFIDLMDGGATITPNSGGPAFEGVQSASWLLPGGIPDPSYWHPDPVTDKYKQQWGFPDYPGMLEEAITPFFATGFDLPWLQVLGNHDTLLQGNVPENPVFKKIATGGLKVTGPPPGIDPCDSFKTFTKNPASLFTGPAVPVTPDPARKTVNRKHYMEAFFQTTGRPVGHGFTQQNLDTGVGYYFNDLGQPIRMICLDTVNPGGYSEGSIGATQMAWLEQRLIEVHSTYLDASGAEVHTGNTDRLVVIQSHHGLRSLSNPVIVPNPFDPEANDLPRVMGPDIEALFHRFPNMVVWFSGHSHVNVITPRPDPAGLTGGFWEVGTASQCDWVIQTRIVEMVVNPDQTISVWCTMLDHQAPADPGGATGLERLASIHRELSANDYQKGLNSRGWGDPTDRNVELVVRAPAWLR